MTRLQRWACAIPLAAVFAACWLRIAEGLVG